MVIEVLEGGEGGAQSAAHTAGRDPAQRTLSSSYSQLVSFMFLCSVTHHTVSLSVCSVTVTHTAPATYSISPSVQSTVKVLG